MQGNIMNRPNILWICTDQQRVDTLGAYGNEIVNTPNLDELANKGFVFENCFSQSPVCTPSRASFLTGRYPRTCRTRQNGQDIPEDEILVTRLLAETGYDCGLAGKLHISACNPSVCTEIERRINDGYQEFHWSHHDGGGWGLNNEYWQWLSERGFEYEEKAHPDCDYIKLGMPEELSQSAWCAEKAMEFFDKHKEDEQPWLFSVNFFDPHHGFNACEDALKRYEEILEEIPLPEYLDKELDSKPVWQNTDHQGAYNGRSGFEFDKMTEKDHRWIRASYFAMVEVVDRQIGKMLEKLKVNGQLENTIIIFTSDHGEMLGDHGIYLKGPYFYDNLVKVPLLFSMPSIKSGRRINSLVEMVDIAPTLLEAASLPVAPGMQGKSLLPLLKGDISEDSHRSNVYCEFYGANFSYTPHAFTTMVRTKDYKLTVAHKQNTGELYDLQNDPGEVVNLWDNPDYVTPKNEMLIRLCDRMAETVDPLPLRRAVW